MKRGEDSRNLYATEFMFPNFTHCGISCSQICTPQNSCYQNLHTRFHTPQICTPWSFILLNLYATEFIATPQICSEFHCNCVSTNKTFRHNYTFWAIWNLELNSWWSVTDVFPMMRVTSSLSGYSLVGMYLRELKSPSVCNFHFKWSMQALHFNVINHLMLWILCNFWKIFWLFVAYRFESL